jgi:hypothetical protein
MPSRFDGKPKLGESCRIRDAPAYGDGAGVAAIWSPQHGAAPIPAEVRYGILVATTAKPGLPHPGAAGNEKAAPGRGGLNQGEPAALRRLRSGC